MANKIEILDAVMGSGKTTGMIKWMKDNPQYRFMYVSPLLSEVDYRIPTECAELSFKSPETTHKKTKSQHLLDLLEEGENVSFTQSLFMNMSKEHLMWIEENEYVLIIDEEIDFIEPYRGSFGTGDIITLERHNHIYIEEDNLGKVVWNWSACEDFIYTNLKRMCEMEMLHVSKRDRSMMVLHLPVSLVTHSHRTIVMTYRYDGSVMDMFMRMRGLKSIPFTEITLLKTEAEVKQQACDLITIRNLRSTREFKRKNYNLTSHWYLQKAKPRHLYDVQKAILQACKTDIKDNVMYTLPKELVLPERTSPKIKIKGYSAKECFLYCATRATNDFSHKKTLVHAFNRHPIQPVYVYLSDYGFPVYRDEYALSECIQWVWRSAIRNGEEITIFFLSSRMEGIFKMWLDGNEDCLKKNS